MRNKLSILLLALVVSACGQTTPLTKKRTESTPAPVVQSPLHPETAKPANVSEPQATHVLASWLDAQNEQDFERYQSLYGDGFEGTKRVGESKTNFGRSEWLTDRKRMFEKPTEVKLKLLSFEKNGETLTATVLQTWKSGSFMDQGRKRIEVGLEDNTPVILKEEMIDSLIVKSSRSEYGEVSRTQLLAADRIVVFVSRKKILGDRQGPDRTVRFSKWSDLDESLDDDIRRIDFEKPAVEELLDLITSPKTYKNAPASCHNPRLQLAFYHEGYSYPFATVGICLECLNVGGSPQLDELKTPPNPEDFGLVPGVIRKWCRTHDVPFCPQHRSYIETNRI